MNAELGVRLGVAVVVGFSAFLWPRDMRRHWSTWTRRARRVTMAVMPVFVAVGLGLVHAGYQNRPLSWVTWTLFGAFVGLNVALLLHFANDDTTERQYIRRK